MEGFVLHEIPRRNWSFSRPRLRLLVRGEGGSVDGGATEYRSIAGHGDEDED